MTEYVGTRVLLLEVCIMRRKRGRDPNYGKIPALMCDEVIIGGRDPNPFLVYPAPTS